MMLWEYEEILILYLKQDYYISPSDLWEGEHSYMSEFSWDVRLWSNDLLMVPETSPDDQE